MHAEDPPFLVVSYASEHRGDVEAVVRAFLPMVLEALHQGALHAPCTTYTAAGALRHERLDVTSAPSDESAAAVEEKVAEPQTALHALQEVQAQLEVVGGMKASLLKRMEEGGYDVDFQVAQRWVGWHSVKYEPPLAGLC